MSAVEIRHIDGAEVNRILVLHESHFLDLKRREVSPGKLSESISAFANTAGGELFVGIGENSERMDRFWAGIESMESANGLFQVIGRMTPLASHYHATWLLSPQRQGYVLHLAIPKTRDIVFASDGNAYLRDNAQNRRVEGEDALQRLRFGKGLISFEDQTLDVPTDEITNSRTGLSFMIDAVPSAEPVDWMRKQNLIVSDRPVVAGVLLFSDEPQAALPKRSGIKIYRYRTKSEVGSRDQLVFQPISIDGAIYEQIANAVQKTKSLVEEISTLEDTGLASVTYPDETLHEILTNAVLHRDYSVPSDIHVRIYDNRIEVESPGRLPGHITTHNVLTQQFARNPKIVRLINKFPNPPNKDVGEGLNAAFDAMKRLKLKEPEIVEGENSVIVHIRHAPLASPQDAVMRYLEENTVITNRIGRDLTGITSENVMKDVFLSLAKREMLEKVPERRGNASAWRKFTGVHTGAVPKRGRPRKTPPVD